jgi:pyridoxamine 5'-phosphate oxidase
LKIQHRNDYSSDPLLEKEMMSNPMAQFANWYRAAELCGEPEANAFHLATSDAAGNPDLRVVLMKEYTDQGIVFFTNYTSKKGSDLLARRQAAANFFWVGMNRQVRFIGEVEKLSREDSEAYFQTRPLVSRLGAIVSRQSAVVASREVLENELDHLAKSIPEEELQCPNWWGGFLLKPKSVEFWQGRENRLHDRIRFVSDVKQWSIQRLYP